MKHNLLMTGGAGFIGTHQALAAGHGMRMLGNLSPQIHGEPPAYVPPAGAEFQRGDLTCRADPERALADVDAVVHLAAKPEPASRWMRSSANTGSMCRARRSCSTFWPAAPMA